MAYKQGITCGASVTLLIGSAVLIGLYVACSELSCPAMAYSYLSPLWTGGLLMVTAFLGIFMSSTKSEKGCGGMYLFLSMLGVVATMGCVCLTLYAFLWEIGLLAMFLTATTTAAPTTVAATTVAPTTLNTTVAPTTPATTPTDPVVFYSLWGCMACVAFGLFIMTCVTSCQYSCCCQEPVVNERVVVVTQNQAASPQNITLETTNTIVNQPPTPQPIVLNTLQPGSGQYYLQQLHPEAQQAMFGPPVGQQPVFLQAQPLPRRPSEPDPQAGGSRPADNQSVRQDRWLDIQHTYEGNPPQELPGPPVGQHPVFHQAPPLPRRPSEPEPQAGGSIPADNQSVRQGRLSADIRHTYEVENPGFNDEDNNDPRYTYTYAGPRYLEPNTVSGSPTPRDNQLYEYIIDPRPSTETAAAPSGHPKPPGNRKREDTGKRSKTPKRRR